jgi:hypothetical protein
MADLAVLVASHLFLALVGGAVVWRLGRETIAVLREQVAVAQAAERTATDRVVAAWRAGATIPPRPADPLPPPEPLPELVAEAVAEWDDPQHRLDLETEARQQLALGRTPDAILRAWENRHP